MKKFATADERPLAGAAIKDEYKKLIDAKLVKMDEGHMSLTSGGERIVSELMVVNNMAALTEAADRILEGKEEKEKVAKASKK